jgi:excisionase family DNA binding protein
MLLELDTQLAGHLRVALEHHRRRLREQAIPPPAGLAELASAVSSAYRRLEATTLDEGPDLLDGPVLLLTKEQTGRLLNVGERTVERLIRTGKLPAVKIGAAVRVPREAVEVYVSSLLDQGDGASTPKWQSTGEGAEGCLVPEEAPAPPAPLGRLEVAR